MCKKQPVYGPSYSETISRTSCVIKLPGDMAPQLLATESPFPFVLPNLSEKARLQKFCEVFIGLIYKRIGEVLMRRFIGL